MLPSEHLQKARDLITPPGTWTQRVNARDYEDVEVALLDPEATCFCSVGALRRFYPYVDKAIKYLNRACTNGFNGIIVFNDSHGRTQDEILAVFDKAIALAKSEGR